jgi:hypothetical protein
MAKKTPQPPVPEVLSMVLADNVHRDTGSGKFTIIGTYKIIGGASFPLDHASMVLYTELTDGRGKTPIELRLIDVNEERDPVFNVHGEVNFTDPTQIHELVFIQVGVRFPKPGEYRLQLLAAGRLLRERRVFVVPVGRPPSKGNRA